jgi:hypothetical protein
MSREEKEHGILWFRTREPPVEGAKDVNPSWTIFRFCCVTGQDLEMLKRPSRWIAQDLGNPLNIINRVAKICDAWIFVILNTDE